MSTVACLFPADAVDATAVDALRAQLPSDITVYCSPKRDASDVLADAARAHPDRDVLLVAAECRLPAHFWQRLQLACASDPRTQVWTPLCGRTATLDPRPADSALTAQAVDHWAWLLADRGYPQTDACSPLLSLWRATAIRACIDAGLRPDHRAAPITRLRLCDTLFVAADGDRAAASAEVLPAVAALRARLPADDGAAAPIGLDDRPVLLHVLHGWGGGAQRFVADLIAADDRHRHLLLVAHGSPSRRVHGEHIALYLAPGGVPLRDWPMGAPASGTRFESDEYRQLFEQVCADFGVAGVLLSSLIGHSLDVLRTALPVSVVCHDYYPVWPILHADFGDLGQRFDPAAIGAALVMAGSAFEFAERRAGHWQALRAAYLALLAERDALLIAPSQCVRDNLSRIAPELGKRRWAKIGHGLAEWPQPLPEIGPDPQRAALRVVIPGRLRGGKGESLVADLLPRLPADVELVLLGCGAAGMRFFGHPQVHVLLDYRREQLPALLAGLHPDVALLPATVAETFSYTLSELRALGVPVIATARGSFVERIRDGEDGLLVSPTAEAIAGLLGQLSDDCAPLLALRRRWPTASLASMAAAYADALRLQARRPTARATIDTLLLTQKQQLERQAQASRAQNDDLRRRLAAQAGELDRRADWANREHRQAEQRLAWALALQQEVTDTVARLQTTQQLLDETDQALRERGAQLAALAEQVDQQAQAIAADRARFEQETALLQQRVAALTEQRDHFESERNRIVASSSWRMTRPLRYARRLIGALLTRLRFRLSRLSALRKRALGSLRVRGLGGTWRRLRQQAAAPKPSGNYAIPDLPETSDEIPNVDDIRLLRPAQPRASVIIPVFNHLHHTVTCLRSLSSQPQRTAFEVIVVDDCSTDASADLLTKMPGLRYVRNAENLGFIGACNAGAAQANGEYLVFLNNDTAVQAGWLDALIDTFSTHPDAGLVGAKLVYPDGRLQEAGGIVFNDGSGWNYGRFDDPADPRYNFVRDVDYCSGAAIALPAELFHALGGFDRHYAPAYYEDTDLALQVRAAGHRVLYQPHSEVVHFEGVTAGTDTSTGVKAYQVVNQQKFVDRWRQVLQGHCTPPPGTAIEIGRQQHMRRRVLVIDATVPQPDQDSGSLRLVNLMRVLLDAGCAVTFFADNRAYVPGHCEVLQQLGVEVLWHPWLGDPVGWLAEHGKRFHAVLVSRHYIACSYLDLVRRHAPQARFIFDTVDLHYLREQRAAELAGRADLARSAEQTRRQELDVIARSDVTLVVSPVEQQLLASDAVGARVEILSNIHEVPGCRRGFDERKDLVFIGGFQHPPNVDAAVWFVGEVWPLIRAEAPDLRFHLIGSKSTPEVEALGSEHGVVFHGYVADIEPYLDGCRVAVAPLRYGAGVKGKVNMSMSYGQPVVATATAVEGMHLRSDEDVLTADDAREFAQQVLRLYGDPLLWQRLSDNGVDNVNRHFGFDAARRVVERLLY